MPHELRHAGYLISDDPARLDVDAIHAFLTRSVWAESISLEVVARAVAHSLCIGIYTPAGEQIGLVRVISDYATFAYLCDVYVLEAQRQAIALVRPGVRFMDVHQRALKVLVDGLRHLGVLQGTTAKLTKDGAYQPYFMHGTSHWLGLDVHDVGAYREDGESVVLRPGMVLTVEPGLYIAPDAKAPRQLRGIGVRIEDDILVTRTGHDNLSGHIPSAIDELEAIVRG